ncbi:MAG TPA: phage recombination protein Bet, partial [Nitrosopumilaceae archaeon]|nr:phage recombination protein Bet [Nitrosopumilaceae archaeon]
MSLSTFVENDTNLSVMNVLKESLYPTASTDELVMLLNYCKARRIDPILKVIHLVPMSVKTGEKDKSGKDVYKKKNVIMPGIGLYRIDAVRTGQYAGISAPEFGEDVTEQLGEIKVTYPRWCEMTIRKILPDGTIAEFTAKEYWKENYATKNNFVIEPNTMWLKRPYGQLAKCTEAQVLRKAFPDAVGQEYTKEEMEGKYLDNFKEPSKISLIKETAKITQCIEQSNDKEEDALLELDFKADEQRLEKVSTLEELEEVYKASYKFWAEKRDAKRLKKIVDIKDIRKK